MSCKAFDQLKSLYELQLYSNVTSLANLILTISEHDADLLNSATKYQTYVYYGDSLFHMGQFQKAESIYKQALEFMKTVLKSKKNTKPNDTALKDIKPDTDIKYQMHLCHVKLHHSKEAIDVLESIPRKKRNAKINMALAKLYHQCGMGKTAIRAYKEVLKECPMAVEAAEGLLNLGVSGADVGSLVVKKDIAGMDWFTGWLKAQEYAHKKNYTQAITTYKQLEEDGTLRGNQNLLIHLGEAYYYIGDSRNAIITLQRARSRDPTMQRGLDVLAALLANEKRINELERLVPEFWCNEEYGAEVWTALSYITYAKGNVTLAAHFVQQACFMNSGSVEALVLKGRLLYDSKMYQDAVPIFRQAFQIANHRFEPCKGLVMCYMAMHKIKEAATIASNAHNRLGNIPRILTLYASALMEDPVTVDKAKSLLEKALELDETHLPAVYLLCEILEQKPNVVALVDLLKKHVALNPTPMLYNILGDIYVNHWEYTTALDHYHSALKLDPNNKLATEGIQLIQGSKENFFIASGYFRREPSHNTLFLIRNL